MIAEFWLLPPILVLLIGGLFLRLRGRSRPGRNLHTAAFAIGLLLLLWPGLLGGARESLPLVVLVDGSRSMGPRLDDFIDLAELRVEPERRLLVILVGTRPILIHEGRAADLPEHLAAPGDFGDATFRSRADLDRAFDFVRARLDGVIHELRLVGDGGFDAPSAPDQALGAVSLRSGPSRRAENLALSFTSPPPLFGADRPARVEIRVSGLLQRPKRLRVLITGQEAFDLDLPAGPIVEDLRFEVLPSAAPDGVLRAGFAAPWTDADASDDADSLPVASASGESLPLLLLQGSDGSAELRARLASDTHLRLLSGGFGLDDARLCVIDSLPAESLPFGDAAWRRFVTAGGGLFLVGSNQAFGAGGWEGRAIDDLSPLRSRPGRKARLLRFALDRSGSMAANGRFAAASASVRALFASLGPQDILELVLFAADRDRRLYERADPEAAARLARDLTAVGASGGTDLRGLLDQLSGPPEGGGDHEVLVVVATDGRDPRGLDQNFVSTIAEKLRASSQTLQLLWFDRDPSLGSVLEILAGDPSRVHAVDDFGRLVEPFFAALGEELAADDVEIRRLGAAPLRLSRLLRTRRDEQAEIVAAGGADENGLARIDRGLGRVAAAPVAVDEALAKGLFERAGRTGYEALSDLLVELAGRSLDFEILRVDDEGAEALELRGGKLPEGDLVLANGVDRLPLRRLARDRARTAPRAAAAPAGRYHLLDGGEQDLGAVLLGPAARRDLGPEADPARLQTLAASLGGTRSPARSKAVLLPLLLVLLLAIDLMLRSRDR